MSTKIKGTPDKWEEGALGLSPEHAVRADDAETSAIERAAGISMQLISIRMPTELLKVLKQIAKYHGIGYQPMIRDLLDRWAIGEIKTILREQLDDAEAHEQTQRDSAPLVTPLVTERERRRA